MKSFFRGKKCTVEAGIYALLVLVSHDKSGKSSSLAELFDHICEREGVVKQNNDDCIFLYQERRFAKLGKAASSIIEAYPILRMVLDETHTSNQLVEACQIYMGSELFYSELEALAYFNYTVTFPFLHFVEVSSQADLLEMIPKFYTDLLEKKTNTLQKFIVAIRQISITEPTSELGKHLVDLMCLEAAKGVMLQCGREYGFSDSSNQELRATDLSTLSEKQLEGLPTNNLATERLLAVFDHRAQKSAKCRNFRFKAKSIRNDLMLYKGNQGLVEPSSKKLTKLLSEREKSWNDSQKRKAEDRIAEKLSKALNSNNYTKKLLVDCKSWSGPFTSPSEMLQIINKRPGQANHILRTEIAYLAHTQKGDKLIRPKLYKINGLSFEEKIENLSVLLFDEPGSASATVTDLPTNEDVLKVLKSTVEQNLPSLPVYDLVINHICAVSWLGETANYFWCLGYVKDIQEDCVIVDHLCHANQNSSKHWKYPSVSDIQSVSVDQILDVTVEGDWNSLGSRSQTYTLHNENNIKSTFTKFCADN